MICTWHGGAIRSRGPRPPNWRKSNTQQDILYFCFARYRYRTSTRNEQDPTLHSVAPADNILLRYIIRSIYLRYSTYTAVGVSTQTVAEGRGGYAEGIRRIVVGRPKVFGLVSVTEPFLIFALVSIAKTGWCALTGVATACCSCTAALSTYRVLEGQLVLR